MYTEKTSESFIEQLGTKYKDIIHQKYKKRVLISKKTLDIQNNMIIKGYIDDTSIMVFRNEKDNDIIILDIPKSFYNYFIGKSGVLKIKHEKIFEVVITELKNYKIRVEGNGKFKFRKYVLDKIYNIIF